MTYQIITDTACDYPTEMYKELDLVTVPLTVMYKGEAYTEYSEAWLKDLFAGLRAGEAASTSAVNPDGWANVIEPVLQEGKDALIIAFSSGLSTTYQSAVIAADELKEKYPERNIRVVDSLCASLGQGLLVWYACQKRDAGMELNELADWVETTKWNLCHWFTVDDLKYLKRGGRISAATALVGTMLNIKPVLHVDDEGHLVSVSKVRGRKTSIEALAQQMEKLGFADQNDAAFICHGDCLEDAQHLAKIIKERCGVKEVFIGYTGAVIGSHSGPGTLALFFLGQHR
jgi:DegV family protein with EDD domain